MPQNFLIDFTPDNDNSNTTSTYITRFVMGNTIGFQGEGLKILSSGNVILSGTATNGGELFITSADNNVTITSQSGFSVNNQPSLTLLANESAIFKLDNSNWDVTYFSTDSTGSNSQFMIYDIIN